MGTSVLILATHYDDVTAFTYKWAQALHEDLLRARHQCIFLDVEAICHSGASLSEAVNRSEFVVFYGHGQVDRWIALPAFTATAGLGTANDLPLVTQSSVHVVNGRHIYASCCHSLVGLGQACIAACPNSGFIGYNSAFGFEFENHELFRDVVNPALVKFVGGTSKSQIARQLTQDWDMLRHDFMYGKHTTRPNAFAAGQWADTNRQTVGYY